MPPIVLHLNHFLPSNCTRDESKSLTSSRKNIHSNHRPSLVINLEPTKPYFFLHSKPLINSRYLLRKKVVSVPISILLFVMASSKAMKKPRTEKNQLFFRNYPGVYYRTKQQKKTHFKTFTIDSRHFPRK